MSEQKKTCRTRPEKETIKPVGSANKASSSWLGHLPPTRSPAACPPPLLPPESLGVPAAAAGGRPWSFKLRPRPGGGLSTGPEGSRGLSLLSSPLPEKESEPNVERRRFPLRRGRFIVNRGSHSSRVLPLERHWAWWQVWLSSSRHSLQTQASQPP